MARYNWGFPCESPQDVSFNRCNVSVNNPNYTHSPETNVRKRVREVPLPHATMLPIHSLVHLFVVFR